MKLNGGKKEVKKKSSTGKQTKKMKPLLQSTVARFSLLHIK